MRTVNIDMDFARYSFGHMHIEHPFLKEEGKPLRTPETEEKVTEAIDNFIKRVVDETEADDYLLIISGTTNFRYDVAKTFPYKGKRKQVRPYHYSTITKHLEENYQDKLVVSDNCEADDELALRQTHNTILASLDKDLLLVNGWHYSWEAAGRPDRISR